MEFKILPEGLVPIEFKLKIELGFDGFWIVFLTIDVFKFNEAG